MFEKILERLRNSGWKELCPGETFWNFGKKHFICYLNWNTGEVTFVNLIRKEK